MTVAAIGRGIGHAKAILVGEHHVLDGSVALALGLPALQTVVELQTDGVGLVCCGRLDAEGCPPEALADTGRMLVRAAELAGCSGTLQVRIQSTIPVRRGLGSSAALAVAAVRAAVQLSGRPLHPSRAFDWAREVESVVHGRSSGLDPAAAATSGAVLFQRGAILDRVTPSPLLTDARWCLLNLGTGLPTREAIAQANAARLQLGAEAVTALNEATSDAAHQAAVALAQGDISALADALARAGAALEPMGVVTPAMRHVLELAVGAGALAAKQTGAGCGGMLLALAPDEATAGLILAAVHTHISGHWILPVAAVVAAP